MVLEVEVRGMLAVLLSLVTVGCLLPGVSGLWSPNNTDDFVAGERALTERTVQVNATNTVRTTKSVGDEDEVDSETPYLKEWDAVFDFRVIDRDDSPTDDLVEVRSILGEVISNHSHQLDVFTIKMYCVKDCDDLRCDKLSVCENRASTSPASRPHVVEQPASVCKNNRENCERATSIFVNSSAFSFCCARVNPNAPSLCHGDEGNTNACWQVRSYKTIRVGGIVLETHDWFVRFDWLESRPLSIGLLAIVIAMFVALCLLIIKWRKTRGKAVSTKGEDPDALHPMFPFVEDDCAFSFKKNSKILLVYYPDCDELCDAVAALAQVLRMDGACEVTDMCGGLDPMDLEPLMSAPDVHVLIIPSRVGKMGHNVYFDQMSPGRIVEPAQPKDASHRLFYNFLYHARAGSLRLKPERVAVIGFHPAWQEEHYEQALGGLRNMETYLVPENTSGLLKWLHGLSSTMDLRLDAASKQNFCTKIDSFRHFIATDDDYHLRHVLVVDAGK